ncbi:GAF domain-containing protein [Puerhibacterium puerhi]|uniref:GAF domain-containing protein n=1 Tax=Puerhibacterium puerhi TaxID=2692623 RepID=UPI001359C70D|nr:GAF domain-containing protein [Puerhibacterium puerhi]
MTGTTEAATTEAATTEAGTASAGPGRSAAERRLDTLTAMADDLAGHFELVPLLERILRHTVDLLGCDSGSVCTVDEAAGTYRKEVDLGVVCEAGRTFPLAEGVTGAVVRARAPVILDEYAQVPGGHIPEPERSALHGVIGVPIRWNGSILGTCVVFSRDPGRRFTPDDAALLELFATHAAIAITNARLHAQAAERASEAAAGAERERVVRDVHDTVGRGLAAVLLHLDAAGRGFASDDGAARRGAARSLAEARTAARAALAETRRTALGLGPSLLDGRSLAEALGLELAWVKSTAGLAARLVTVGEPRALAPDVARQLFRIVQEALTNVVEHAAATGVRVGLVYGDTSVSALVEDDGRGFDPQAVRRGLGLRGLAARAQHLGGTVVVDSTPGWGTRVRAEVPYAPGGARAGTGERWRVLVVHPSPVVRAGLVRMLESTEPDVQVVAELADPAQAVEAYGLLHPHVVLTALHMPHVDGVQLTSYLRAADPHAAVVLVVGSVADDRVREAATGGAVGFVGHDVDAAGLARAVVAAARGDQLVAADLFAAAAPSGSAVRQLTPRERQVRALLEQGLAYKQVATRLGISIKTVEKHVGAILRKTGAPNRAALHALPPR